MLNVRFFLLSICCLLVAVSCLAEEQAVDVNLLVSRFQDTLLSSKPNFPALRSILHAMPSNEKPFSSNTVIQKDQQVPLQPLLHLLFNFHMLSKQPAEKAVILEVIELGIAKGLDVSAPFRDEPPLYFKALVAREFRLLRSILFAGKRAFANQVIARNHWLVLFMDILYAVPCEVVPLSKLLLYVEKLVHTQQHLPADSDPSTFNRTEMAVKLLGSASLGKPSVKAAELLQLSPLFRQLVQQISREDYLLDQQQVPYSIAGSSAGELVSAMDRSRMVRIEHIRGSLDELVNEVQLDIFAILSADNRWTEALKHFLDLLTTPNAQGRSAFHFLALANAQRTLSSILTQYSDSSSNQMDYYRSKLHTVEVADQRGHSPHGYCVYRYGPGHETCRMLAKALGLHHSEDSAADNVTVADEGSVLHEVEVSPTGELRMLLTEDEVKETGTLSLILHHICIHWLTVCLAGGWDPRVLPEGSIGQGDRCDILQIWDADRLPSNSDFFQQFINTGTPVIFRGAAKKDGELMTKLRRTLAKDAFLRKYGPVTVPASALPYGDSFGVTTITTTLAEVAGAHGYDDSSSSSPLYAFLTPGPQWVQQLTADVPVPGCLTSTTLSPQGVIELKHYSHELQFYLGAAGSGAPVHVHGHAINTLAYGRKQWALFPPKDAFYSTIPAKQFFSRYVFGQSNASVLQERPQMLTCTQHAGDIIYVPSLWAHGTLNVQQSIGVAHEFSVEQFCME